jgi:hypothetical protein
MCLVRDISLEDRKDYICISISNKDERIDINRPLSSIETNGVIYSTKEKYQNFQV